MRILVCLKQVPDTLDVQFGEDFTLRREHVAQVTNPADESALELGLALREQQGGTVTVLSMGPRRAEGMLREALALGADEAVLLNDPAFAGADTLATATALHAAMAALGPFDMVLCGRRATDGETGQVGPMLASLLGWACIVNAMAVTVNAGEAGGAATLTVDQLTEEGTATWQCQAPAVLTLCEWRYRLRLPSIAGLRRAGKATVRRVAAAELGLAASQCGLKGSPTRVIRVSAKSGGLRACQRLTVEALLAQGVLP
jgi:electron transfer flavoprotein beta subunit